VCWWTSIPCRLCVVNNLFVTTFHSHFSYMCVCCFSALIYLTYLWTWLFFFNFIWDSEKVAQLFQRFSQNLQFLSFWCFFFWWVNAQNEWIIVNVDCEVQHKISVNTWNFSTEDNSTFYRIHTYACRSASCLSLIRHFWHASSLRIFTSTLL
jgi:hypothetical protein